MGYPVLTVTAKQVCISVIIIIYIFKYFRRVPVDMLLFHKQNFVLMVVMSLIRIMSG